MGARRDRRDIRLCQRQLCFRERLVRHDRAAIRQCPPYSPMSLTGLRACASSASADIPAQDDSAWIQQTRIKCQVPLPHWVSGTAPSRAEAPPPRRPRRGRAGCERGAASCARSPPSPSPPWVVPLPRPRSELRAEAAAAPCSAQQQPRCRPSSVWWWATGKLKGPSAGPGAEPLPRPGAGVGQRGGSGPGPRRGVWAIPARVRPGRPEGAGLAGAGAGAGLWRAAGGGWMAAAASCSCCRPGREARARRGRERVVRGSAAVRVPGPSPASPWGRCSGAGAVVVIECSPGCGQKRPPWMNSVCWAIRAGRAASLDYHCLLLFFHLRSSPSVF